MTIKVLFALILISVHSSIGLFLNEHFKYPYPHLDKKYDFIIVGAGNAGCVLANRLSKNPKTSVLLIEAGKGEIPLVSDIPLASTFLQSTAFNYGYVSEPQTRACLGE
jgi:hypothetical protein